MKAISEGASRCLVKNECGIWLLSACFFLQESTVQSVQGGGEKTVLTVRKAGFLSDKRLA